MDDKSNKLIGTSLDISAENRARFKDLFPSVFTETVNEKGELVESVDFEKLKAELGTFTDIFEARRERYGMDWPGKKDALRLIQTPSAATLKPCREESVNFDTTENLFIEGDNLEVLKLLQKSYYGKIKMIYIDPPYNTGKEFIYPDNFTETLETYLEYAGLIDGEGKKFSTNTANEGRFHTKWLNMMYPRLYLARNLLRDNGVIFISIDDNEVSNLRKMCDEIFGEENFVAQFVWQSRQSIQNDIDISINHEYLVSYAKNRRQNERRLKDSNFEEWFKMEGFAAFPLPVNKSKFSNPDNDPRGDWKADPFDAPNIRPNLTYPIINPKTKEKHYPPEGRCWRTEENKFKELLADNRIIFGKTGDSRPQLKVFYKEKEKFGSVGTTWLDGENYGTVTHGTKELMSLFGGKKIFDFPKPTIMIKSLMKIAFQKDDIILDFFAGSATTAHAMLDLNQEDGGNRKFILVQLPEPCAEDSETFKAGYKTIADIGKDRIRRVIKKFNKEQEGKLDLDNGSAQDRGFKTLKLDKSNFKQWQKLTPEAKVEEIAGQLSIHIDHIDQKATREDLLYEILIKAGFMPTEKIQAITLADIPVFSIANGDLLICLAEAVTKELINAVAESEPMQFICLDSAFHGNDQLKANAVQTFKARNQGREKPNQIVFKTI